MGCHANVEEVSRGRKFLREVAMSGKVSQFLFALLVSLSLLAPSALSQGIGGAIEGVVKDESGAAVPAAVVKLTNAQTGQVRTVSTDNQGFYVIREVPPGNYDLTVERPGFNTAKVEEVPISVAQVARLGDITLNVTTIGQEQVVVVVAEVAMTDVSSPTLSTSFTDRQIRELPILTRDINNLALLAPGVFSVRTFSFASTLVPFAANGSRGRDNNFIIDSVDNNEPLFGGAAAQFTNTDLFVEYRILTNQYKAEYGRNSGSVVNIITERGGNEWHGTAFFFGQHDQFNAANSVERTAQLGGTTRYYETQAGATLGGPIRKEKAWTFVSYQWDRARNDLSPLYPQIATMPTPAGQTALRQNFGTSPTVQALLNVPTVSTVAALSAPCGRSTSGLPTTNPCTIGTVNTFGVPVDFGTYLVPRAGVFDVRDHQFSGRFDTRLSQRDDFYVRYLFDDLRTPRITGGQPGEVGFSDFGRFPESRISQKQRTQSLGLFWTRAWATALHELRGSFTRISSQTGAFDLETEQRRESLPSVTVVDTLATGVAPGGTAQATGSFLSAFTGAGDRFSIGRDTRPTRINSNILQLQDNFSFSKGNHGLKVGGNIVRTQTNVRQIPSDLGQYIYFSFEDFVDNFPLLAWQRFGNFRGRGGDVLPVRELGQFYFLQDDIRVRSNLTISLGLRYENYGQATNRVNELNPGAGPKIKRDDNNLAPRVGFAWSPDGDKWVLRGGYGVYYNPTAFNIALISWQGGRVSPFVLGFPTNTYPAMPFSPSDPGSQNLTSLGCDLTALEVILNQIFTGVPGLSYTECTTEDGVNQNLINPLVQNYSLSLQHQVTRDLLVEVSYVGSNGSKLFQRLNRNPRQGWELDPNFAFDCGEFPNGFLVTPCKRARPDRNRGGITEVTNTGFSSYHALQISGTQRLSSRLPVAVTASYTWSHMIDNASEIFGPGVRFISSGSITDLLTGNASAQTVEAITPFPQDSRDPRRAERGNSSFDRTHRVAVSFLALLPSPDSGPGRWFFGDWQVNGIFTAQSGQPFSPLNAIGNCLDANGDSILTNDRPLAGNPSAPVNSVAILAPDSGCTMINPVGGIGGYVDARDSSANPQRFTQAAALSMFHFVQAPLNTNGDAGRNILRGPNTINLDLGVFKNFPWGERRNLQVRVEAYNVFNRPNPGNLLGNVFTSDAQPVPAIAFLSGSTTPSRVTGVIPENALDAVDTSPSATQRSLFLSRRFMNTGARRLQLGVRFIF